MKRLVAALYCCLLLATGIGRADSILVVSPTDTALTREFVSILSEARPGDQVHLHLLGTSVPPATASRLITMGPDALAWRLEQLGPQPTIATYLSSERLQRLPHTPLPAYVQVLLSNPHPERQLELARLILPRIRSVGLLYSEASESQLADWQRAAASADLELRPSLVSEPRDLGRGVAELLDRSDVLMALDDPQIYNADNLKALLLSSYRRGKVLIGPGPAFVPAGSLSTTYSSVADTAASVTQLLDEAWVPSRQLYPQHFSVTSNQHVARSLGLPPLDDAALAQAIRQMRDSQ